MSHIFYSHRSIFIIFCVVILSSGLFAQNRLPLRDGQINIFANGINIAWSENNNFARDLTNFNENNFNEIFNAIEDAGGNACRWWLHTNGSASPQFDDNGMVTGLSAQEIPNMKKALDMAYERGIVISMCLWSFDMLQSQGQDQEMMKNLLEDPEITQSYIDNALIPILQEIGDHPAVMSWEIFNEPEGMTTEFGWTPVKTEMQYVQQFINLLAGAIHREVPSALVSNGSWNMRASSGVAGINYYSDEKLIEAGGDEDGTLDFVQVHFYPEWEGNDTSPFHHSASYWGIDKPIVIGEFPADGIMEGTPDPYLTAAESYERAYLYGYAGVMSWSWSDTGFGGFEAAKEGISYLADNYMHGLIAYDTAWTGDEGPFITGLDGKMANEIVLYPNPASDLINIRFDENEKFEYEVVDVSGKILVADEMYPSDDKTIDISAFPTGVYHLKIINEGNVIIKRFVKG